MAHEPISLSCRPLRLSQLVRPGRRFWAINPGTFLDRDISKPWSPMVHVMASAELGIRNEPVAVMVQAFPGAAAAGIPATAAQPSPKMALAITFWGSQP